MINIVSAGKFSSDRSIMDYAKDIWNVEPYWNRVPSPQEGKPGTMREGEPVLVDGRRESFFDEKYFLSAPHNDES